MNLTAEPRLIMQLRDLNVVKAFAHQPIPEGLLDLVFSMDDEEPFNLFRVLAGKELAEIFIIAMGAHAADTAYFGIHLMQHTKDMHFFGAGHQAASQATGFAIPYHQDGITGVLYIVADVML